MPPIAVHARFTAKPGREQELRDAVLDMLETAEREPGTHVYAVHVDRDDEAAVVMYELYADDAALEAHGASDAARRFGPLLDDLLAREPEAWFSRPLRAKGLTV